jgi:hypothetical protein
VTKYSFIAMTVPVEGKDDEFNAWYNDVHVPELLAVPGITSARRFRTKFVNGNGLPAWKYVAIYECETDDLGTTLKGLGKAGLNTSDALDRTQSATIVAEQIFAFEN